jgi:hypothetical protein
LRRGRAQDTLVTQRWQRREVRTGRAGFCHLRREEAFVVGRWEGPVPDGPLYDFAQGLRDLRAQAPGAPTYRELARRANYAASVLSTAAAGRSLPTLEVTLAYVRACGAEPEEAELWRERWTKLRGTLRHTHPELLPETSQPRDPDQHPDDSLPYERPAPLDPASPTGTGTPYPSAVTPLTRSDPARVGPYRLLGRLGRGAMATVYLGSPTGRHGGGEPVAVKVVHTHLAEDPLFRRRFAAEIAAARRVHGPYTPRVLAAGPDAARPWMASVCVPGPSLGEVVDTGGPLPGAALRALAAGVAEALVCIHAAGVLHRDLKPSNVLMDTDGPKVIDFGVARAADASRLTQTGARVGTVPFMAPEQADGRPVTEAADVFALGSLLAYAGTGVTPFGDGPTGEVLYRIVHGDPDPAALDLPERWLRDLVVRCLDKDPGRRPTPIEIVAACTAHRPRGGWLPAGPAARTARRGADVTRFLTRAGRRRRTALRTAAGTLAALVLAAGGLFAAALLDDGTSHAARSPYALVYADRRLTLPDYDSYIDLPAGRVVEGDAGWTVSTNSGGDSKGAFDLEDDTRGYVPAGAGRPDAARCAAGAADRPLSVVRFPRVPSGHWFCLRWRKNGDVAVIKVIDLDDGDWGAKLAVYYYEREHSGG